MKIILMMRRKTNEVGCVFLGPRRRCSEVRGTLLVKKYAFSLFPNLGFLTFFASITSETTATQRIRDGIAQRGQFFKKVSIIFFFFVNSRKS
jgi:hypothetical protein